jgi:hypothetical protein
MIILGLWLIGIAFSIAAGIMGLGASPAIVEASKVIGL